MEDTPSSSDDPIMPRLSFSQRTTAPAMATDPWMRAETDSSAIRAEKLLNRLHSCYLQGITGRLVPAKLVGHSGQ